MWYFLIRQNSIEINQYQLLQKKATLTEVEIFNEPYENWYVFSVEKADYSTFVDLLDREGINYDVASNRPDRSEIRLGM